MIPAEFPSGFLYLLLKILYEYDIMKKQKNKHSSFSRTLCLTERLGGEEIAVKIRGNSHYRNLPLQ